MNCKLFFCRCKSIYTRGSPPLKSRSLRGCVAPVAIPILKVGHCEGCKPVAIPPLKRGFSRFALLVCLASLFEGGGPLKSGSEGVSCFRSNTPPVTLR